MWSFVGPQKYAHYMIRLFPDIQRLLEFLSPFEKENFDSSLVRDVPIGLKLLADAVSDVRGCNREPIKFDNFRGRTNPSSVQVNNPSTCLARVARYAGHLRKTGGDGGHLGLSGDSVLALEQEELLT